MTRPKVPPEQRQRTAQACEVCKRRKQKCNGLYPCNTCEKRKFTCSYLDREGETPGDGPPPKKLQTENDAAAALAHPGGAVEVKRDASALNGNHQLSPNLQRASVTSPQHTRTAFLGQEPQSHPENGHSKVDPLAPTYEPDAIAAAEAAARSLQHFATRVDEPPKPHAPSGTASTDGNEEEAVIYSQMRMLQDPTGRLLYVGDAASLSFLQLLRMMVENVVGPSAFTTDPRRHKITEIPFSLPPTARHTYLLPDKRTAYILVESFFVNTHGFLQVFDRTAFTTALERCYSDPLTIEPSWLCLLNLVFAIGLMLATPRNGTPDAAIIEKLHREHADRAEVFYLNAKSLNDPLHGFEDADFWSVQALLLMSYYMLVKSKRNTAFALLGMAVRSAYALGLHREETMVIFGPEEQTARRNLWRSLFVMDRFLSFSLGRPTAISEDDCSGDTLRPAQPEEHDAFGFDSAFQTSINPSKSNASALEAAVRSCSVIGRILKEVYQQRKISTRLAQEIADVCKLWPKALAPQLHWRQAPSACSSQGIAILHVNLFYCHSIILLTRPFFLYIMNAETQKGIGHSGTGFHPRSKYPRMEKFSEACVIASSHSIVLVQAAYEAGYLPRRNPAVIYFLFAAALILLANEFAGLYIAREADHCIQNAINVISYCAEVDQQAARLFNILQSFKEIVHQQRERRRQQQNPHLGVMGHLSASTSAQQFTGSTQRPPVPADPQQFREQGFQPDFSTVSAANAPQIQTPDLSQQAGQQQPPPLPSNAVLSPSAPGDVATVTTPLGIPTHIAPPSGAATPRGITLASSPAGSSAGGPPSLSRNLSLSNLLDLNALDSMGGIPSVRSEDGSSGPEEHIDFDALWAWPSNTPAVGSPRVQGEVQGISDSAVPLFGVYDQ